MSEIKAQKPLKYKLIKSSLLTLVVAFLVASVLVFFGIDKISLGIVNLVETRSAETKLKLTDFATERSKTIKQSYTTDITLRASNTLKKDSATLSQLFQDNSFLQVRDFVDGVFKDDKDLIRATFFVVDSGKITAWHYIDRAYPRGTDLGTEFDSKTSEWVGTYKGKKVRVSDPAVAQIAKTNTVKVVESKETFEGREIDVMETYVPVFKPFKELKELHKNIAAAKKAKSPIGYLRYTVSLDSMYKTIAAEQESLKKNIDEIEAGNKKTASDTRILGFDLRNQILFALSGAILVLLVGSFFFTQYISTKITEPINRLIQVATKIAQGEYKQVVDVETNDEVGILAQTIQKMSSAIVKRDEELAEFNKSLESLVEQRTAQLHLEMKKVQNLLDSMKQSVFTINKDIKVIDPVSKFSREIFEQEITGKNIDQLLFHNVDTKAENYIQNKTVLSVVFGESDLQWMLMEDNLPKELVLDVQGKEKTVEISYNPLFGADGNLEQLMYLVEDVTVERQLKAQIELERKQNQEKTRVLEELARRTPDEIKSFFSNAFNLMETSYISCVDEKTCFEKRLEMFRNLHTVKGNAKVLGFEKLAAYVHNVEQVVSALKDKDHVDSQQLVEIRDMIRSGQELINEYCVVAETIFQVPNHAFVTRLKDVHNELMQTSESGWSVDLLEKSLGILKPYMGSELRSKYSLENALIWVQSEILNRGMVFEATLEPRYLRNMPDSLSKIISICEYQLKKNKSVNIKAIVDNEAVLKDLYNDLANFKDVLQKTPCTQIKAKLKSIHFKVAPLKKYFEDLATSLKSDYVYAMRCFEVVNTYVASSNSLGAQMSEVVVYLDNINKIKDIFKQDLDPKTYAKVDQVFKRMEYVPLKKSFGRYFSVVEATAQKMNKSARLAVHGHEVFLSNSSIDLVNDCLVHLIRNSIDHGIESSIIRSQLSKPEAGTISILVQEDSQSVKIIVEDDGQGINPQILREKLVSKHIYTSAQVMKMSDQEIIECILLPEFSTKDQVSDISGRGVGMDAVKKIVENEMGGKLHLRSVIGRGSTFEIEIPRQALDFDKEETLRPAV